MSLAFAAAGVAVATLLLYAIFGGADFGGGVWDLLASGPRRDAQRDAITEAIGPVWEANHVWLIFANVTLFTCFAPAYAEIATRLNAPLTFALAGIVLRGAAFVFRNYAGEATALARAWTVAFGAASIVAPFFLGDAAGAIATGRYAWTSPFALAVGIFAVVLCAQVAAVFLLRETTDPDVRGDFRRRAIGATAAVWVFGALPAAVAYGTEPALARAFAHAAPLAAGVAALLCGLAVMRAVATGAALWARAAAGAEVAAVLVAWFAAQSPALVPGRFTVMAAASPDAVLTAYLVASAAGAVVLIPSLWLLFSTFKGPASAAPRS